MKSYFAAFAVSAMLIPAAITPVAAQIFQIYDGVAAVRAQSYTGDGFAQSLAAEYRRFTLYEADEMADWIDAEHFADKALASARGRLFRLKILPNGNSATPTFQPCNLPAHG